LCSFYFCAGVSCGNRFSVLRELGGTNVAQFSLKKNFLHFSKIHLVLSGPFDAVFVWNYLSDDATFIYVGTRTPIRSTRSPTLNDGMAAHPIPGGSRTKYCAPAAYLLQAALAA